MKGLIKRGDMYHIDVIHKGQRYRKSVGRNKKLAELALAELRLKLERGEIIEDEITKISFYDFCDKYLEYSKTNKAETTYERDGYAVNVHFKSYFNNVQLTSLNSEKIESYKNERTKSIQNSTVNRELEVLKAMLRKAVEWGYLRTNPAEKVKKIRTSQKTIRYLSKEEADKFLEACKDQHAPFWLYPFTVTGIYAGLRKSELFNLQWDDLDLESRILNVQNKENWHTKNYESRVIPMHYKLYEALNDHPHHEKSSYVFYNPDGSRFKDIRGSYEAAIKRADIDHITFHAMRHTFASHLVMNGVDLPTVQKLLGHKDITTTMIYAHLAPDHLKGAIDRLDI